MMNRRSRAIAGVFVVLAYLATAPGVSAQEVNADYKLHAGDSITVSVWKELELQRKVIIRPSRKRQDPRWTS